MTDDAPSPPDGPMLEVRVSRNEILALATTAQNISLLLLSAVLPGEGPPEEAAEVQVRSIHAVMAAAQEIQEKVLRLLMPAMAKLGPLGAAASRSIGEAFRALEEGSPDVGKRFQLMWEAMRAAQKAYGSEPDDAPPPTPP